MRKLIVGVMGPGESATSEMCELARDLGKRIASEVWVVLSGGRNVGVMNATCEGAKEGGGLTAGGGGSTTAYSYQAPGYVNGITRSMRHPEAGVVEMPSWEGTWDNKFRDLVSLTGFNPNHNSDNAGPVRNPEWFYPKTSDVVSGTDKPTGVLADASGCSPCAAPHFKDSQGISLPESRLASRCDGSATTDVPAPIPTAPPQ